MKKKILSLVVLSIALLTACNKTDHDIEQQSSNELTFSVNEIPKTRGTLISSFTDGSEVGVYAYCSKDGSVPTEPNVMNNKLLSLNNSNWSYSPTLYWSSELDNIYNFYAYAPYVENTANGITPLYDGNGFSLKYEVPTECADQPDLMIAKTSVKSKEGPVSLNFEHALAAIAFQVQGEQNRKITSISISNIYTEATLTYDDSGVEWTTVGSRTTAEYNPIIKSDIAPDDSAVDLTTNNGYLMMIPQEVPYTGITVTVTIEDDGKCVTETKIFTIRQSDVITDNLWEVTNPSYGKFDAGILYTFVIDTEDEWIQIAEPSDIAAWKNANPTYSEYLVTDFIDFEYSREEVEGTNWRSDQSAIDEAGTVDPSTGFPANAVTTHEITITDDVSDDVLPQLINMYGSNVTLPIQDELMYMWIFKGNNSFSSDYYWSSGTGIIDAGEYRSNVSLASGVVMYYMNSDDDCCARAVRTISFE